MLTPSLSYSILIALSLQGVSIRVIREMRIINNSLNREARQGCATFYRSEPKRDVTRSWIHTSYSITMTFSDGDACTVVFFELIIHVLGDQILGSRRVSIVMFLKHLFFIEFREFPICIFPNLPLTSRKMSKRECRVMPQLSEQDVYLKVRWDLIQTSHVLK